MGDVAQNVPDATNDTQAYDTSHADSRLVDAARDDQSGTPTGPKTVWVAKAGGENLDAPCSCALTASGSLHVAGFFEGKTSIGQASLVSLGSYDIFLARLSPSGQFQWAKSMGSTGMDGAPRLAVDTLGNSFVTGSIASTATFGSIPVPVGPHKTSYVVKLDNTGKSVWVTTPDQPSASRGNGIAVHGDNIFVTGSFEGDFNTDSGSLHAKGDSDVFVARLTSDGNWSWVAAAGGSGPEGGSSIGVDAKGNTYLIAQHQSMTLELGSIKLGPLSSGGLFAAGLGPDGGFQWASSAAQGDVSLLGGVGVSPSGDVRAAGFFYGNAAFGTHPMTSNGDGDVYVAAMSAKGVAGWVVTGGGPHHDLAWGTAVDNNGNVYVTGKFRGTMTLGGQTLTSVGNSNDVFIVALDAKGNVMWATSTGGTGNDSGGCIAVDKLGTVLVAGGYIGDTSIGGKTLGDSGQGDMFFWKFLPPVH
jgi:hypothetical protein